MSSEPKPPPEPITLAGLIDDEGNWEMTIGGVDVWEALGPFDYKNVCVALDDETFRGRLRAHEGWPGYSSWTPGMSPEIRVGDSINLFGHLMDAYYNSRPVTLTVRLDDES